jgi:hypothetical protein
MTVPSYGRRRPTKLSVETMWEIFLQVRAPADAPRIVLWGILI